MVIESGNFYLKDSKEKFLVDKAANPNLNFYLQTAILYKIKISEID